MNAQPTRSIFKWSFFKNRKEHGFTLVEMLIVIGILAIVGTIATTLVINATQSDQKFSASNMTQGELLDSVARITTQTTYATGFLTAEATKMKVTTNEDGIDYETSFFYWDNSADSLPTGVDKNKLPNQNAFLEYKVNKANGNVIVTNLISNYTREASAKPIFTYYNNKDEVLTSPVAGSSLASIKRVGVYFAVTPDGRDAPMEIATSAIPLMSTTQAAMATGSSVPIPQRTDLRGVLPPGNRTASLEWSSVAGATQYNIMRDGALLKTVGPNVTTLQDPNLDWGTTYSYSVVVTGYAGQSAESNIVRLTVVPEKTRFININPTQGLSNVNNAGNESGTTNGVSGQKYTVARDLTNQIVWEARKGATSYKLLDGNNNVIYNGPNTMTQHARNYGDVTTYTVIPSNTGEHGSGGSGLVSDPVTLISPPVAPTIKVVANDDTSRTPSSNTVTITNNGANTKGYIFKSGTANGRTSEFTRMTTPGSQSPNANWGSTTWYAVVAFNDAGNSPESNNVEAKQKPGPFNITGINQTARSYYTNRLEYDGTAAGTQPGAVSASWGGSSGANGYTYYVDIENAFGGSIVGGTANRSGTVSGTSFSLTSINPGTIYQVKVISKAANGTTREATVKRFQTAPDVPRNGQVWLVCQDRGYALQFYNHTYLSDTRPLFGAADRTSQVQFSNNGAGSGKNYTFGPQANRSDMTNSDGNRDLYSSGFNLTNQLDIRSGVSWGQTTSATIKAYGQYKAGTGNGTQGFFEGCNGNGGWNEPLNPCYGYEVGGPTCGQGKGKPNWNAY